MYRYFITLSAVLVIGIGLFLFGIGLHQGEGLPALPPDAPTRQAIPTITPPPEPPRAGTTGQAVAVPDASAELAELLEGLSYGEPVSAANLTVVPLIRTRDAATPPDEYLTLEEALAAKTLVIKEVEGGGNVPELEAISTAEQAIFIPFGSVVTGGKQNRMLRRDVIIAAKEKCKLPVYCVEQGRWSSGGSRRAGGPRRMQALACAEVVVEEACMIEAPAKASLELKQLANEEADQGRVWSKVAEQNRALANRSGSADFNRNYDTAGYKRKQRELAAVKTAVPGPQVVGYVALIDGAVVGCEIFASPKYFAKVWPQLFDGMVVSAAASEEPKPTTAGAAGELAAKYMTELGKYRVSSRSFGRQRQIDVRGSGGAAAAAVDPDTNRAVYFRYSPVPLRQAEPAEEEPEEVEVSEEPRE